MLLLCLVAALIAQAACAAPPPTPNGGFEQGAAGRPESWTWASASESLRVEWTDGIAHTGRRAIRIRVPGELNTEVGWTLTCAAPVPIEPGRHVVSFWLKAKCDRFVRLLLEGHNRDKLVAPRLGDDSTGYDRQGGVLGFGPCDWTRFEREIVVPAGVATLRMQFAGKYGSDLLLDDV